MKNLESAIWYQKSLKGLWAQGSDSQILWIRDGLHRGETRSQSYRAFDYAYIDEAELQEIIHRTTELAKHIAGFMKYLKNSGIKGTKFR